MDEKKDITTQAPPEELETDIAQTRREISGTVGAIRERISSEHIRSEAKDKLRESTVRRMRHAASRISFRAKGTGSHIVDAVKSNPAPLAMVSAGVAWFLINRSQHNGVNARFAEGKEAFRSKAEELSGKAQETAGELKRQAFEKGSVFAERTKITADRYSRAAQQTLSENPLAVTAAAVAVGMAFGLLIPETRKEKEMMGTASESLISKARESAEDTLHKAQHAAEKALQTAKEEFK